jgi:hypothetical protein
MICYCNLATWNRISLRVLNKIGMCLYISLNKKKYFFLIKVFYFIFNEDTRILYFIYIPCHDKSIVTII